MVQLEAIWCKAGGQDLRTSFAASDQFSYMGYRRLPLNKRTLCTPPLHVPVAVKSLCAYIQSVLPQKHAAEAVWWLRTSSRGPRKVLLFIYTI